MKFPYIEYEFAPVPRPVVPIRVEMDGQSLRYDVLVDSGADMNVFDLDIARALGIDVEAGEEASLSGVTGEPQPFYIHDVVLHLGQRHIATRAGFTELAGRAYGVLGQQGFFEHFKVTFNFSQREVEITPANGRVLRRVG